MTDRMFSCSDHLFPIDIHLILVYRFTHFTIVEWFFFLVYFSLQIVCLLNALFIWTVCTHDFSLLLDLRFMNFWFEFVFVRKWVHYKQIVNFTAFFSFVCSSARKGQNVFTLRLLLYYFTACCFAVVYISFHMLLPCHCCWYVLCIQTLSFRSFFAHFMCVYIWCVPYYVLFYCTQYILFGRFFVFKKRNNKIFRQQPISICSSVASFCESYNVDYYFHGNYIACELLRRLHATVYAYDKKKIYLQISNKKTKIERYCRRWVVFFLSLDQNNERRWWGWDGGGSAEAAVVPRVFPIQQFTFIGWLTDLVLFWSQNKTNKQSKHNNEMG